MKVLIVTPYYPTDERPYISPFIQRLHLQLKEHIDVDCFHFKASRSWRNYWKASKELKYRIAHNDYDIIHMHWGHTISVLPLLLRTKLVTTFHGSDVNGVLNRSAKHDVISLLVRWVSRWAAYRSDHVIYVSQHLQRRLRSKRQFSIIPSGVDIAKIPQRSRAELRKELGWTDDHIVILFIGNPGNVGKRYDLARELVDNCKQKYPNAELHLVWEYLPDDIFKMMKAADLLLQTSLQEGSPTIVKEALACGLKIVSTPVGDVVERLTGVDGCYVAESIGKDDLNSALEKALDEVEQGVTLSNTIDLEALSVEREANEVIEVYHKVLNH